MRSLRISLVISALVASLFAQSNPIPFVNQPLVPAAVAPGGSAFTLTVNGSGFVSGAVVNWNGVPLATAFVNHNRLTATVPDYDIAAPATVLVTVANPTPGGGASNSILFTITRPMAPLTFSASTLNVGTTVVGVIAEDFNSDGKTDLAIVDEAVPNPQCFFAPTGGTLTVLLGNGDGTFTSTWTYDLDCIFGQSLQNLVSTDQPEYLHVTTGDFNGDGKPDLAVTWFAHVYGANVAIFLGNGDGTFTLSPTLPSAFYDAINSQLAVGDFNGDGKLDYAYGFDALRYGSLAFALGNSDGSFMVSGYSGYLAVDHLAVGDFNSDGVLDLAADDTQFGTPATILLGNGDGSFTAASSQPSTTIISGAAGDFNGDGILDLISSNGVLLGNGNGTFTEKDGPSSDGFVADLNGDGKLDLVNFTSVLLGNGDGTFQSPVSLPFPGGPKSISVADFNGDGRLDLVSANGDGTITVLLNTSPLCGPTTSSLLSSLNPSNFNRSVTLTATVTSQGCGTPTGTVTFSDGSTTLGTSALSSGTAIFTTASLGVGTHSITAVYSGDSNFSASSGLLSETVNQASATVALTSSPNPSGLGQATTFTATISPQYGGQVSGTVTFKDGSTTMGSGAVSGDVASLTTGGLTIGTHSITAVYSGDSNFTGSTSNTLSQVVANATTTTTLLSSINPSVSGKSVTFTATVSSSGGGTATGKIEYLNGTAVLATVKLTSGSAKYTTSRLPPGSNSITAVYGGDSNNSGSTSASLNQFVIAATTTTLTSSPNPSTYGQVVVFTTTVNSSIGAPPDGEVITFTRGTTVLGTGPLSGGTATFSFPALAVGTKAVKAAYGGDANFASSTSTADDQVIATATSATALSSSQNPSSFDQPVTFVATVSPQFNGTTPTGSVTFYNGTATLGTVALINGVADYTTTKLAVGTGSITAVYRGSSSFSTSSSAVLSQVVNQASTTTTALSSLNPSNFGQSVTFTATVAAQFGGTVTGSITFMDGTTTLKIVNLSGGAANYTTTKLVSGTHNITANYNGNTSFNGSSASLTQTVN